MSLKAKLAARRRRLRTNNGNKDRGSKPQQTALLLPSPDELPQISPNDDIEMSGQQHRHPPLLFENLSESLKRNQYPEELHLPLLFNDEAFGHPTREPEERRESSRETAQNGTGLNGVHPSEATAATVVGC